MLSLKSNSVDWRRHINTNSSALIWVTVALCSLIFDDLFSSWSFENLCLKDHHGFLYSPSVFLQNLNACKRRHLSNSAVFQVFPNTERASWSSFKLCHIVSFTNDHSHLVKVMNKPCKQKVQLSKTVLHKTSWNTLTSTKEIKGSVFSKSGKMLPTMQLNWQQFSLTQVRWCGLGNDDPLSVLPPHHRFVFWATLRARCVCFFFKRSSHSARKSEL